MIITLLNQKHKAEWVVIIYFISILENPSKQPKKPMNNGQLHTKYQVLRLVVASAEEAEPGALSY